MTMLASAEFEKYVARQVAKKALVTFDQMIFCNIAGLSESNLGDYLTMPTESQIVHRANISRAGYVDENKVVYSAMLGTNIGDFEFNYIALINRAENVLAVACFTDTIRKRKNKGRTYGNSLSRNLILQFSGARELTGINIPAESWQVDFTSEFLEIHQKIDRLSDPDGFQYVGQCESIAQLRTIEPTEDQQRILVKSYHARKNLGGGVFYADFADTTTADNAGTVIVTAGGKRWKRVYSTLNIFDFGVRLDSVNNDAINRLQAWQEPVLGLGNVIPASSRIVPASHISQVAYRFNGIDYLSEDYYKTDLSQITRTGYYTAWTQDKAFVHNGVIYAPFMLACRHGYDDLRIAWVRSFDNGNTWTTPEILMDYHPQNPTLGWHCFSMGIVGNRLFMLVEERDVASKKMVRSFLYSRVMTKNFL
ncbi:phage tail protein [Mannheimia haemolytica]